MPMITIAGLSPDVETTGASEPAPVPVGAKSRSYGGQMRVSVQREPRGVVGTLFFPDDASYRAFRAAVPHWSLQTCTGDALNNVPGTFLVSYGAAGYVAHGLTFRRSVPVTLEEV